jgi:hypothetical protein
MEKPWKSTMEKYQIENVTILLPPDLQFGKRQKIV